MNLLHRLLGKKRAAPELREGRPEYHELRAREALGRGRDLPLGLLHLADLLAFAPARPESLDLLRAYADRLDFRTLPDLGRPASDALRAWDLRRRGRDREALELLLAVARALPDRDYLGTWGIEWLELAGGSAPDDLAMAWLAEALRQLPEPLCCTRRRADLASRFADLALGLRERRRADPSLDRTTLDLLRRAGRFQEALRIVQADVALRPDAEAWTRLGLLLRDMGEGAEARAAFSRARQLDPADPSPLFEGAALHLAREEWSLAYGSFQEILARDPQDARALAGLAWCTCRAEGLDERSVAVLVALAEAGNRHAREWLHQSRPYVGVLPRPRESSSKLLRRMASMDMEPGRTVQVALPEVESPSNLVAFRLAQPTVALEVQYANVARPDPRLPVEPTAWQLWRLEGATLEPALPPAPWNVQEMVQGLAAEPFESRRAWARASTVGAELGPEAAEALLACLLHPSLPPPGVPPFDWTVAFQFAALQAMAFLDEGWRESARRRALFSVLLGPRDWTTEMAAVVLARLAQDEPMLATDVGLAFQKLDGARPDSGEVAYEPGFLAAWATLPGLSGAEGRRIKERLRAGP